jgi:hypothetical protein
MNAERCKPTLVSAFIFIFLLILTACAPTVTPTLFRPPSGVSSTATSPVPSPVAVTAIIPPTETLVPASPTPIPPCTNALKWLADLTFLDDTLVLPGQRIDKQWSIQNSGTCDWDAHYRLRNINGETLGAPAEMPLFPARAGATITLSIVFLAPSDAGTYRSEWQAVTPDGTLFGDTVYIKIVVANP